MPWGCKMQRFVLVLCLLSLTLAPAIAGVDPTRPESAAETTATSPPPRTALSLSAILLSSDRHLAVINGVPRAVGARFDGVVLERIAPDRVQVRDRWGVRTLQLLPSPVKLPARPLPARETDG